MDRALAYFRQQGFVVDNVCRRRSYDLHCTHGSAVLHVEVKGTKSRGEELFLTPGELRFARDHADNMALFVVHSVDVGETDGSPHASGGKVSLVRPWRINDADLAVTGYCYSVPVDSLHSDSEP
jgi:hypothetical protein